MQSLDGFATRLDVRALALVRRRLPHDRCSSGARAGPRLDEPLGGPASPIYGDRRQGRARARPRRTASGSQPIALDDEPLYLREDALLGFETTVGYENGRLPVGDGEAISMVAAPRRRARSSRKCPRAPRRSRSSTRAATAMRAGSVLGWIGRLVPRALPPSEAPAGMRGFVAFAGEGMVLVDGR